MPLTNEEKLIIIFTPMFLALTIVIITWLIVKIRNLSSSEEPKPDDFTDFKNEKYRVIKFEDGTYAIQIYKITYGIQYYPHSVGREWITLKPRYQTFDDAINEIRSKTIETVCTVLEYD